MKKIINSTTSIRFLEELHNLYSSPNIIRMIKSRKDEFGQGM
jgi:hypothetical protein